MHSIFLGFKEAFLLILNLDRELMDIIFLSIRVSGAALLISTVIGLPIGALFGLKRIPMKTMLISISNTFMGLPPVVVGLFVYILLSRSGLLGPLGLLYTPSAMVIAQTILAFPIVVSLCSTAIINVAPIIKQASMTLGATQFQTSLTIIKEARYGIISGIVAAFGRVMAEVGAILIVGGNIAGYTRVMTTTIALETDKGNFELAIALGIILLMLSLIINAIVHSIQRRAISGARRIDTI
ncbi:tungstate ABC transporter permease [Dissulfurispira thermophila]|uniref:Tungstate ABC transporter permease n=1 Tax=Dissulfurispira thermophila TaxID=2715679 RepID=A0A7G1H1T6_9BACT|nr:ABC transporter permease [Dissulfurispira thermophila]BCB96754.1 tungstate ABC transporter permease [Dissulfurispira thermophila]